MAPARLDPVATTLNLAPTTLTFTLTLTLLETRAPGSSAPAMDPYKHRLLRTSPRQQAPPLWQWPPPDQPPLASSSASTPSSSASPLS